MINEERVKHMTRMAIFEKERGPEFQPMLRYNRKDYIALHGWGGFVAGTIFFWVVYLAIIMYFMGEVLDNLSTMYILLMVLVGLLCYAAYIVIHVYNVRRRAKRNYKKGKNLVKELGGFYTKLSEMYEAEEWEAKPKQVRNFEFEEDDFDNDTY